MLSFDTPRVALGEVAAKKIPSGLRSPMKRELRPSWFCGIVVDSGASAWISLLLPVVSMGSVPWLILSTAIEVVGDVSV